LLRTKALYRALVNDVASLLAAFRNSHACERRHIGQPVCINLKSGAAAGALRVSCDARDSLDRSEANVSHCAAT